MRYLNNASHNFPTEIFLFKKKSVLKNFAKLTGKQLRRSLFIIKMKAVWGFLKNVPSCKPASLLNRDSDTCFLLEILRSFSQNLFCRIPPSDYCHKMCCFSLKFWKIPWKPWYPAFWIKLQNWIKEFLYKI